MIAVLEKENAGLVKERNALSRRAERAERDTINAREAVQALNKYRDALKARAEKAEKESGDLRDECANATGWETLYDMREAVLKKAGIEADHEEVIQNKRAEEAEAKLAAVPNDCREVCEDHKALKAKLRRAELLASDAMQVKAQLAAIEKDLRERIAKYKSGRGKGGLYSILLKELEELLGTCSSLGERGKHFPDKAKKEAKTR
jgi:chromosome segregation ATPase